MISSLIIKQLLIDLLNQIVLFLQAGKNYMLREFSTRESKVEELQVTDDKTKHPH